MTAPPRPSPKAAQGGKQVTVLCEGDPFFYGSFMYLFARLRGSLPGRSGAGRLVADGLRRPRRAARWRRATTC